MRAGTHIELQPMPGEQLADSAIECATAEWIAIVQPLVQRRRVAPPPLGAQSEECLYLGRKSQATRVDTVVQRLDAQPIPRQPDLLRASVIHAECEHAIQG